MRTPVLEAAATDPNITERLVDLLEYAARVAIPLGALKVFFVGVYKPFVTWRREHTAKTIREVLKPELDQLKSMIEDESGCAGQMKEVLTQMRTIFHDLDLFLEVSHDNRERQDETNELLDEVFGIERRVDLKRRKEIDDMLALLAERRKARRRALLVLDEPAETAGSNGQRGD